MKYNLAFKYRIYPNKEQELLIFFKESIVPIINILYSDSVDIIPIK